MVVGVSGYGDYSIVATDHIEQTIRTVLASKDNVFIALSGGSTPLPVLGELRKRNLDWDRLFFFMVDERIVPLNKPESNFGAIRNVFFDHISSRAFSMVQDEVPISRAIEAYETTIRDIMELNGQGFPVFDLILLGMGDDGHTASLFPGTKALSEHKKWIVKNEVPQLNTFRITFTYPTILSAKEIIVLIKGHTKKQIYNELVSGGKTTYPMQKVVNERKDLKWILEDSL